MLTDASGSVTDTYAYTAFGETEGATGFTQNDYLYTGEQFDPNLGFYYLRARYYNPGIGRFATMDSFAGRVFEPVTLHKYLYANADPVGTVDPSGLVGMTELAVGITIVNILTSLQIENAFNTFDTLGIDDPRIDAARTVNRIVGLAFMGAAGVQIYKLLSRKFAKNADRIASQVGQSNAFVFVNQKAAAQALIGNRGAVSATELRRFVPPHIPDKFKPSGNIAAGEKYGFSVGDNLIELKWHSINKSDVIKFPNSPSALGWTAQIKMNGMLLGLDGNWYRRARDITHIPLVP